MNSYPKDYQPTEQEIRHDAHQAMLERHREERAYRRECHKKGWRKGQRYPASNLK